MNLKYNGKVAVLLSSYNGEKYIAQQLDSILAQTYKNIEITVRDDGSSDSTVEIVKKYSDRCNISVIEGKNIGFCKSFYKLLECETQADYYAFLRSG